MSDEHDLVLELRRVDQGWGLREYLVLGDEQMARLVRLERAGAISQKRWNAIVDQSRALDVGSPCIESVGHLLADKGIVRSRI